MNATTRRIAALVVAAALTPVLSTAQSSGQKRPPPPKGGPATSAPAPGARPQTRKPAEGTPPAKAVPRPPEVRPPARQAPRAAMPPPRRTLIYPFYLDDFDVVYRFPYGIYPYGPYVYPPYGHEMPLSGCVTAEGERQAMGALRLEIPQRDAAVYVDGFYVGEVGDFNDSSEQLTLLPGPHRLELRAAGFQTMTFDVNIQPERTITYRRPMQPAS